MFDEQTIQQLNAPLDSRAIKRLPTSRNEAYLEGWFVAEQANKLFGYGNWSRELIADSLKCVDETQHVAPKTGELLPLWDVTYIATVKVTVREKGDNFPSYSAEHTGTGGSTTNKAPRGEAHIRAAKAAETDAMKRALAFGFGNQFGLACYAGDSHIVDVAAAMNRLKTLALEMHAPPPTTLSYWNPSMRSRANGRASRQGRWLSQAAKRHKHLSISTNKSFRRRGGTPPLPRRHHKQDAHHEHHEHLERGR